MKDTEKFSPEEREQLSYLGSMLHQEPSKEDAEIDKIFADVLKHGIMIKGKIVKPGQSLV